MNKQDFLVTTGPIGIPSSNPCYGILTMILLCKVLGIKLDVPSYLGINTIANKNRQNLDEFMNSIEQLDAKPKHLISDIDTSLRITTDLEKLSNSESVIEKNLEKLKCPCGKVDCVAENIKYKFIDNGKCVFCGGTVKRYYEKSLLLSLPKHIVPTQCIFPFDFNKKYNDICNDISGQNILISKNRDTGLQFDRYNIDVDVATYLFFGNFTQKNRLVLGTTHVLNKLVIMNEVDNMLHEGNKNMFLMMSYLHGTPEIDHIKIQNPQNIQLYLLNSLGKKENSTFRNDFIYGTLNKLSKSDYRDKMKQYYQIPADIDFSQFSESFNRFYLYEFLDKQR
ncbi:MAG: hypothetical protein MJ187_03885 [Alphaproteobacteria bacterium]|nr:hypothetical protein [Alphaproteobacteria bacterium]